MTQETTHGTGPIAFRATVRLSGKTSTGIPVPEDVVERLGAGKKPAVVVGIGSYSYRSSIASMGGEYMISLSGENREKAGVAAGDDVEVTLALDTAPREVDVPAELTEALEGEADARAFFEGLSYSRKLWFVLQVEGAKTEATRQKRIDKVMSMLRERRTA